MIYGQRIRLRAIDREDLPLFVEWLNDPEVREGLVHYLPFSLSDEQQWFEGVRKTPRDQHPLMIEIQSGDEWLPIGNIALFDFDWRIRMAELGILIGAKEHWNQGYGTEAVGLLLKHAFATLNLNRIFLRVYQTNPRAVRAYEKVGFVHEGRFRQAHYHDGEYVDVIFMSVLRSEWVSTT